MWRWFLVLAACTSGSTTYNTALGELRGKAGFYIENLGTAVDAELDTSGVHCESLDPAATAAVDGQPIAFGSAVYTSWCVGVPFYLQNVHGKTLVVADATDTWTIALPGFDAAGEPTMSIGPLVAGTTATVTWTGGPALEDGCVTLKGAARTYDSCDPADLRVQLSGNQVSFDVPADLGATVDVSIAVGGWLHVAGAAGAERGAGCDGPSECTFSLWGRLTRPGLAVTQ